MAEHNLPGVIQALADVAAGGSTKDLADKMKKGEVDAKTYMPLFLARLGELAKPGMEKFEGSLVQASGNVGLKFDLLSRKVLGSDGVTGAMISLNNSISSIITSISEHSTVFSNLISGPLTLLSGLIDSVGESFHKIINSDIGQSIDTFKAELDKLTGESLLGSMGSVLKDSISILSDVLILAARGLGLLFDNVISDIESILKHFGFNVNLPKISSAFEFSGSIAKDTATFIKGVSKITDALVRGKSTGEALQVGVAQMMSRSHSDKYLNIGAEREISDSVRENRPFDLDRAVIQSRGAYKEDLQKMVDSGSMGAEEIANINDLTFSRTDFLNRDFMNRIDERRNRVIDSLDPNNELNIPRFSLVPESQVMESQPSLFPTFNNLPSPSVSQYSVRNELFSDTLQPINPLVSGNQNMKIDVVVSGKVSVDGDVTTSSVDISDTVQSVIHQTFSEKYTSVTPAFSFNAQ